MAFVLSPVFNKRLLLLLLFLSPCVSATDVGMKTVITTGAGSTEEEAIQSAAINATRQVVGEVISYDITLTGNEITSERIYSLSRGVINSIDVQDTRQENGIYFVDAAVSISVEKLVTSINESKNSKLDVVDKSEPIKAIGKAASTKELKAYVDNLLIRPMANGDAYIIKSIKLSEVDVSDLNSIDDNIVRNQPKFLTGELIPLLVTFDVKVSDDFKANIFNLFEVMSSPDGEEGYIYDTPYKDDKVIGSMYSDSLLSPIKVYRVDKGKNSQIRHFLSEAYNFGIQNNPLCLKVNISGTTKANINSNVLCLNATGPRGDWWNLKDGGVGDNFFGPYFVESTSPLRVVDAQARYLMVNTAGDSRYLLMDNTYVYVVGIDPDKVLDISSVKVYFQKIRS